MSLLLPCLRLPFGPQDQPQGIGTFVDEHGQEFCVRGSEL